MSTPSFNGLRVLALESRRATETAALIANHGGLPTLAPSMREVPIESNIDALAFADGLIDGAFDIVVFLTGVGTRTLIDALRRSLPLEPILAALSATKVVVRGPKPLAVLREFQIPIWLAAPEPNTWRELLAALDGRHDEQPLGGARIAVQEYGVANEELLEGLRSRGAQVTQVPVYRWALPEDLGPLKEAVAALARGHLDVVVFTTGTQIVHLLQVAREAGAESEVRHALARMVIASIGPDTSAELKRHGLVADIEPSHPKIGILIRETAERAEALLHAKRAG